MLPGSRSDRSDLPTSGSCWLTFSVRSKASSPFCTSSRISIAFCRPKPELSTSLRNCLRVSSILRASEISSSRVSSGISPICVRYMRTGSSIFSVMSTIGAASSASVGSCTSISGDSSISSLIASSPPSPPSSPGLRPFLSLFLPSSSTTSRPASSIMAIAASSFSGEAATSSGSTAFNWLSVIEPVLRCALIRFLSFLSRVSMARGFGGRRGLVGSRGSGRGRTRLLQAQLLDELLGQPVGRRPVARGERRLQLHAQAARVLLAGDALPAALHGGQEGGGVGDAVLALRGARQHGAQIGALGAAREQVAQHLGAGGAAERRRVADHAQQLLHRGRRERPAGVLTRHGELLEQRRLREDAGEQVVLGDHGRRRGRGGRRRAGGRGVARRRRRGAAA